MSRMAVQMFTLAAALALVAAACGGPGEEEAPRAATSAPPTTLVDPSEIIPGGPPPDGIPAIDEPKFETASSVTWLASREPVIAIEINGDARAYPVQILMWHEIVNDRVGDVPVAVTYCPLCNTGIAFQRPVVKEELLDFGTSGKLYRSNLVMYDRQTRSYWPQVTGQAVMGPLAGTQLELIPVQLLSWGDWLAVHPNGKVLSRDTGHRRQYGENPYVGYDQPGSFPFLFQGREIDPRLDAKARVVGVRVGEEAMAFPYDELRERAAGGWAAVAATVAGRELVVFWKDGTASPLDAPVIQLGRSVGATGVYDPNLEGEKLTFHASAEGLTDDQTGSRWDLLGRAVDGPLAGKQLNRIVSIESFWFDWAAFFPDTGIFGQS